MTTKGKWGDWTMEINEHLKDINAYLEKHDMVNKPPHYTLGGIETIDYIEAKSLNYHLGNVVKYVSRAGSKGDALEDLKKAKWYLEREINNREKKNV